MSWGESGVNSLDEPTSTSAANEWPFDVMKLPPCGMKVSVLGEESVAESPSALGLADLDDDGDLDLFAALPSAATVELAFNNGVGDYTSASQVQVGQPQSDMHIATGDLDGDNGLDLAVALSDSGQIVILFAQQGKYTPGPVLVASGRPRAINALDIDLNGTIDLMTLDDGPDGVSAWFGDGLGGFAPEQFSGLAIGATKATVANVDFDNTPDILSVPENTLQIFFGNLHGVWKREFEFDLGPSGWSKAFAADFNDDLASDLVVTRRDGTGGLVMIIWGLAPWEWGSVSALSTVSPLLGGGLIDVTNDGIVDLVSSTGSAKIAVLVGSFGSGFSCELVFDVGLEIPDLLAFGDVNGDGHTEIVVGSHGDSQVRVLSVE